MKALYIMAIAAVTAAGAWAQSGKYVVECNVPGLPDGSKVALQEVAHEPMAPLCETASEGGRFIFEGELEQPLAVALTVEGKFPVTDTRFILEPGRIELTADSVSGPAAGNVVLPGFKVEGSELSDKYRALLSVRDTLDVKYSNNLEKHREVADAYYAARSARDEEKMKEIEQTEAFKKWRGDDEAFFAEVQETFCRTILSNKDDFFGPLMMISLMNYFDESSRELFDQMSPEAQQSLYGRRVLSELYPVGRIGEKMPQIALADRDGKVRTLQEVCAGKKYVLLDFWASWCRPCRAEIPNFKKLYEEYSGRGFDIMSVSIDDDPAAWKRALDQTGMTWTNVIDIDDKAAIEYKVRAVPTIYLLDGEGCLVAENLRGEELAAKIAELLQE